MESTLLPNNVLDNESTWILGFLCFQFAFALAGTGCAGAAYHVTLVDHLGTWKTVFAAVPTFAFGLASCLRSKVQWLRIVFLLVGSVTILVLFLGGIWDLMLSGTTAASFLCSPLSASAPQQHGSFAYSDCCHALYDIHHTQPTTTTTTTISTCSANGTITVAAAADDGNVCVCCYGGSAEEARGVSWTLNPVLQGSCDNLNHLLPQLLLGSGILSIISGILLIITLSLACCKCCSTRTVPLGSL